MVHITHSRHLSIDQIAYLEQILITIDAFFFKLFLLPLKGVLLADVIVTWTVPSCFVDRY